MLLKPPPSEPPPAPPPEAGVEPGAFAVAVGPRPANKFPMLAVGQWCPPATSPPTPPPPSPLPPPFLPSGWGGERRETSEAEQAVLKAAHAEETAEGVSTSLPMEAVATKVMCATVAAT